MHIVCSQPGCHTAAHSPAGCKAVSNTHEHGAGFFLLCSAVGLRLSTSVQTGRDDERQDMLALYTKVSASISTKVFCYKCV